MLRLFSNYHHMIWWRGAYPCGDSTKLTYTFGSLKGCKFNERGCRAPCVVGCGVSRVSPSTEFSSCTWSFLNWFCFNMCTAFGSGDTRPMSLSRFHRWYSGHGRQLEWQWLLWHSATVTVLAIPVSFSTIIVTLSEVGRIGFEDLTNPQIIHFFGFGFELSLVDFWILSFELDLKIQSTDQVFDPFKNY